MRNNSDLPSVMQRTYLVIPGGNDDLVRELRRNLSTDTVSVTEDATKATATLKVLSAQRLRRVLSVNSVGRAVEQEVAYQVQFSLSTPAGTLIKPQTLILKRNYAYDEANALGDAEQADVLYAALQHDMAQLILFRIEAIGRHADAVRSH
ncbi:MAG: LPS assembly lipoprotein LptE [Gammaproteobacteria bacterium]